MMTGGPQSQAESEVFQDAFKGPELGSGWRWVREENATWRLGEDALEIEIKPGGLWGRVFSELPGPPLLVRSFDNANAFEVTVTMPSTPGRRGEQAGLVWYIDDDNYAKLVVEWGSDGTANVVFAREENCEPSVCNKASLDGDAAYEPIRLRMELSGDGSELSGVVNGTYYMRLVGRCSATCAGWSGKPTLIGLSAHGGTAESTGRFAKLAAFSSIAVRPDRVQWGGMMAIGAPVAGGYGAAREAPVASVQQDVLGSMRTADAPASTWNFSPDLTEAERSRISAMLGMNGLGNGFTTLGADDLSGFTTLGGDDLQPIAPPAASPPTAEAAGWTLSPTLTEAERQEISNLLLANGLPALGGQSQQPVPNGEVTPQNGVTNGNAHSRSRSPSPTV
eukprot:gnl/MRDRNA2_/MRDRNA2_126411_c0_seq1.p1 gnl/MRDRNA2_/MRDRNA2_126411_c0~~gnl/MRDRNA2_/MRDRNA2_126411_c0_seq1.p1  ORF type:complete len:393 (-),score=80.70 gnl/MRDRNA2_/MRDRNA2_126411_c0_seq1:15-1193(-)